MKTILTIISFILIGIHISFGQKRKFVTDTIFVNGLCQQCKERIEDAAFIKGVKKADWSEITKKLIIIYDQHKTTLKAIETNIAKAGHDTGDIKALPGDYNKLPSCCAYKKPQVGH